MPPTTSSIFGGAPFKGSVTAPVGFDAIIPIGAITGQRAEAISTIIAMYGIAGATDWQAPGATGLRSFTGRLVVVEGLVNKNISTGNPNIYLFTRLPDDLGDRVRFDMLLHDFRKPYQFDFGPDSSLGNLQSKPGVPLSVILLSGTAYNSAGAPVQTFQQMLHVQTYGLDNSQIERVGNLSVR